MENKKMFLPKCSVLIILLFMLLISFSPAALASSISVDVIQIAEDVSVEEPIPYGDKVVWDNNNEDFRIQMQNLPPFTNTSGFNETWRFGPSIYGNTVAWTGEENGKWRIYMYNISTSNKTQVTTKESNQAGPEISGNRIVWSDDRNEKNNDSNIDIYTYNIKTSKETRITLNKSWQIHPVISGNNLVWMDGRNGKSQIYMYNFSTAKETPLTNINSCQFDPDIFEDRVVWSDDRNGKWDIYMYNISTSTETKITRDKANHWEPAIYGDKIIWNDDRNGNWNLYVYNLTTSKETPIRTFESNNSVKERPDIYENLVVWQDNKNIFIYDLSTSTETQITTNGYSRLPAIDGNRIVWVHRNGNYSIEMGTITKSIADFSASPISGGSPLKVAFSDRSTGAPVSWNWNFGDGTTSRKQNPTHTYSSEGTYTVTLTIKDEIGNNSVTKSNYIYVKNIEPPSVDFTGSPTSGTSPLSVSFTDDSVGEISSWKWDFGDGNNSTEQNPVHVYSKSGRYSVELTVGNEAGSDTISKTRYITVEPLIYPSADFTASPTSGTSPLNVSFTDNSTGNPSSWRWTFGDGTSSTEQNPVHLYSNPGSYTVKLTVRNEEGSNALSRSKYVIVS